VRVNTRFIKHRVFIPGKEVKPNGKRKTRQVSLLQINEDDFERRSKDRHAGKEAHPAMQVLREALHAGCREEGKIQDMKGERASFSTARNS